MKRMLVNATQEEELRVALVDGQKLHDLSIELTSREQKKANVYKGRISRVEPSLEACFVDYGAQRHGFLPLKEISKDYFRQPAQGGRSNIRDLLTEGQELIVQVEKEERGTKGAALTTFISLAGRFLVLMPNNPRAGGVSRRIEGEDRDQMREVVSQLRIPDGMGAIVRTAGVGRSVEELQWDLDNLKTQWDQIDAASKERAAPFLVYRESDAVTRAMRDYLSDDIGELLVDDTAAFQKAQEYMQRFMPAEAQKRLKLYTDDIPLFTRFQIESQIESAYAHKVSLPSGGSIVIDYTEALVSIDINSARATRGSDIEATATNTNLEAADEIARQLRIRDIGGLIVIDFIDMESTKNQREVEDRLRDAMKVDRARIQIGRLSRFGLLEMSRQRLRPSLSETSHLVCPRCQGIGSIRSVESTALAVLRLIGEELRKDRTARVIAQMPVEVATYLINEKREWMRALEDKSEAELLIVPNPNIETPEFAIKRVRDDEAELPENRQASYRMPTPTEVVEPSTARDRRPPSEAAAVATLLPSTAAPIVVPASQRYVEAAPQPAPELGVFKRLKRWLAGAPVNDETAEAAPVPSSAQRERTERSSRGGSGNRDRDRDPDHRHGRSSRGRGGDDGRRDGRGRDRHRDRDERGDRGDRSERAERNDRGDRAERGDRHDRGDRGGSRDRDRDRDRNRDRDRARGEPRSAQPAPSGSHGPAPTQAAAPSDNAAPPATDTNEIAASGAVGEQAAGGDPGMRSERGDQPRRGRRGGRRRGRRGGGGGNRGEGAAAGPGSDSSADMFEGNDSGGGEPSAPRESYSPPEGGGSSAGSTPATPPSAPSSAEPRTVAHFEPNQSQSRPHVVWSSAPSGGSSSGRGPDE